MTLEEHLARENRFSCGWLSPMGDFYPCHSYDHLDEARKILKKKWNECRNPDDVLMDAGWVYIGMSSFFLPRVENRLAEIPYRISNKFSPPLL